MIKRIFLSLFVILLFGISAYAKTIAIDGFGESMQRAESDALRNAVEKAVGVMVDSHTMADNGAIIEDKILTQSRGYITDYRVLDKRNSGNGWIVSIEANVDVNANSKLMSDLVKAGIIDVTLRNPKIAVVISDELSRGGKAAAEIAITDAFIQAGFSQMINVDQMGVPREVMWRYGQNELQEWAARYKADVVVVGRVVHSRVGDVGKFVGNGSRTGMLSYRAQLEARMYMAKSARIVAVGSKVGSGVDIAEIIAAKNASTNAGKALGEEFVEKLLSEGAGQKQLLELKVHVSDFTCLNKVKAALEHIQEVKGVQLGSYSDGVGIFSVKFSGSTQHLFELLDKEADCFIKMISADYSTLKIQANY